MISETDILLLHEFSILDFGGKEGLRDEGLLLSAAARPFQTFDGQDLYPTLLEKAACLAENLIINHPFIDGNKRSGFLAMAALLKEYSIEIIAENEEIYNFIIYISIGEIKYADVVNWLRKNTKHF